MPHTRMEISSQKRIARMFYLTCMFCPVFLSWIWLFDQDEQWVGNTGDITAIHDQALNLCVWSELNVS